MEYKDYYKILEIDKKATESEIKSAYRKLARKFHPDLNPDDKDAKKKFQEINEANEVLTDPDKRKKYDKYGKDWQHAEQYEQAGQSNYSKSQNQGGANFGQSGEYDFSDFFSSMFGGQQTGQKQGRSQSYKGQDFNTELHLSLMDAYTTHQQTLDINGNKVRITIPAGIENGQVIKLKGHGGKGTSENLNGDLYITFKITPHPIYRRTGNDLHVTAHIDLFTAVLGGETVLEIMNGKLKLKVNPETQNGTKIRLKGKGFPIYKQEGHFGDLYVTYFVKLPTNLSENQKELFRQLSQS